MKTFLALMGAAFHAGARFFQNVLGTLGTVLVFGMISFLGLVWHTLNLHLLQGPTIVFLKFAVAWMVLVWPLSSISVLYPNRFTKVGLVLVSAWMICRTITFVSPNTADTVATMAEYGSKKLNEKTHQVTVEIAVQIPCGSTPFFGKDGRTGQRIPLVYYTEQEGRIRCFSTSGYDPISGQKLEPVTTENIIQRIHWQASTQPQRVVTAPVEAPVTPPILPETTLQQEWNPEQHPS